MRICTEGVVNGTSKILGLVNFSTDLKISTAFVKRVEVVIVYLFWSQSLSCLISVSDFSESWILPFTTPHRVLGCHFCEVNTQNMMLESDLSLKQKKGHSWFSRGSNYFWSKIFFCNRCVYSYFWIRKTKSAIISASVLAKEFLERCIIFLLMAFELAGESENIRPFATRVWKIIK